MAPTVKVLVLGATGPSGICVLRELLHREHATVAYVRDASKIPEELKKNMLLEVIEAPMDATAELSTAISKCTTILSLLGPSTSDISQAFHPFQVPPFVSYYETILGLMRQHDVRRIFAMSTISYPEPEGRDQPSWLSSLMVWAIYLFVHSAYTAVTGIAETFRQHGTGGDVDWTVFRLAGTPGSSDERSWLHDRGGDWPVAGTYVGSAAWQPWTRRGALARWLTDCAESGAPELVGKMPAVSRIVGARARRSG